MTFLDEHIEWMRSLRHPPLGFDEVDPVPGVPEGLPYEIGLWFEQRMPYRVGYEWTPIGISGEYAGNWMEPELDREHAMVARDTYGQEAVETGLFPTNPIGFADFVHYFMTVETRGDRAGWVYLNEFLTPTNGGPIAKSLSQLFYAVRRMTAVGLLDPTDHKFISDLNPPPDTPGYLLGWPYGRGVVGEDYDPPRTLTQKPVAESIRNILPDFDFDFDFGAIDA